MLAFFQLIILRFYNQTDHLPFKATASKKKIDSKFLFFIRLWRPLMPWPWSNLQSVKTHCFLLFGTFGEAPFLARNNRWCPFHLRPSFPDDGEDIQSIKFSKPQIEIDECKFVNKAAKEEAVLFWMLLLTKSKTTWFLILGMKWISWQNPPSSILWKKNSLSIKSSAENVST